ncbi:hypothetical protein Trco_003657 [Trichoderma cornu-damae]|uniref:Uncharacterized protein n=1 Tax=Trichoderma cornu-damae TaxID=654480 RepID=A0A9P8TXH9_9HYPO|nr:hypothetical protein Trco_003657 [Trichoderma cornu-damae]
MPTPLTAGLWESLALNVMAHRGGKLLSHSAYELMRSDFEDSTHFGSCAKGPRREPGLPFKSFDEASDWISSGIESPITVSVDSGVLAVRQLPW